MRLAIALAALILVACASPDPGGVLTPDEVVDRYADAVCTHVAGCSDVEYDACLRDIHGTTEWRFEVGWAQNTTEAEMAACEDWIADVALCGQSIWRAEECDLGQYRP